MAAYGYGSDRSLGSHQAWFKPLQKKRTVEVYEKGLIRGMPKPIEVEEMKSLLESMGCPEHREDRLFELGLFLKGWGGNLQKAAEAYSKTLKWRESFGADSIRDAVRCGGGDDGQAHPFPCAQSIQQAWPHQLVEVDCMCRDGSPFAISRLGMVDTKRLATTVEDEHFELYMVHTLEARLWRIEQLSRAEGRLLQYLDVHDFGTGIKKGSAAMTTFASHLSFFKRIVSLQDHYPEQIHGAMLTNMPLVCRGAWSIAKMLMPASTRAKAEVVDVTNSQNFLTIEVEQHRLPFFLGGVLNVLLTQHEMYGLKMLSAGYSSSVVGVRRSDVEVGGVAADVAVVDKIEDDHGAAAFGGGAALRSSFGFDDGEGAIAIGCMGDGEGDDGADEEPGGSVYESPVKPVSQYWYGPPLKMDNKRGDAGRDDDDDASGGARRRIEEGGDVRGKQGGGVEQWVKGVDIRGAVVRRVVSPSSAIGNTTSSNKASHSPAVKSPLNHSGVGGSGDADMSYAPTEAHGSPESSGVSRCGSPESRGDDDSQARNVVGSEPRSRILVGGGEEEGGAGQCGGASKEPSGGFPQRGLVGYC